MDVSTQLWNELFNQLRRQLLGKLSKYRVPVINNLLPQEQLRSEFFRIAAEYAQDENSLFIVAIDGIDHAARANVSENTFLSALPNPEYLPENVKIVIAGQPKEDYRNYPEWLFNNETGYVKEIHVPSILKSDIYSLVENKFPEMDNVFKNQLTNVVCRYADGNTLSAIFAVHEATQCNDIVALEQRLTDRKLSGNIQEYYKVIWDSAKAKFQIPFVDYKMAGVFAFFNEPLNEYKLQKIFSEEGISISVWRNVLKSMRPLLVETNGNYTILHNDIRVYLSRIIGRDNGYCDIHSDLSLLGPAYINLMGDPVKYIIPDRCVDNTSFSEETTSVEYYEQMIHEYVQDKSYSSTAILEACESLHNKDALKESVVLEIMEHEFFKESSSIERNSLLEYLISFGKAEETDVLIRKYLGMLLQRDHYYCALDVPALVLWKMKQLSPEYGINGMKQILDMHRSYERNSRLLLQSRPDFSEQEHYNITLHHNGIESFQGSNIMCGFSKISLDEFHWHINITVNGMRLFNEGGQEIGRFEYYYGQRGNMGNRYISNQPLLQRWVVSKDAISKARCIVGCPNNIKINHAFDSVIRKYED